MTFRRCTILLSAVLGIVSPVQRSLAIPDDAAAKGRDIIKKYADCVVSVEVVATVKVTVGDHAQPPRESLIEVNGTVISATGLTVTALSAVDPRGALEAMVAARGAGQKIEIGETEFKDVKLRLANNTEVPAVIVLKDPDLNLVFIAPTTDPASTKRVFPFISLDKSAPGELLGTYFIISRAAKAMQRVPIVRDTTVAGIVEKPRRMYILSEQAIGVPVFDESGMLLGVMTQYLENGRPGSHIALPAADVAELAVQAAAVKPEDKEPKLDTSPIIEKPPAPADTTPPKT